MKTCIPWLPPLRSCTYCASTSQNPFPTNSRGSRPHPRAPAGWTGTKRTRKSPAHPPWSAFPAASLSSAPASEPRRPTWGHTGTARQARRGAGTAGPSAPRPNAGRPPPGADWPSFAGPCLQHGGLDRHLVRLHRLRGRRRGRRGAGAGRLAQQPGLHGTAEPTGQALRTTRGVGLGAPA